MSTKQMLADVLLEDSGGLYEWAMAQRRGVTPKSWDQVAAVLGEETEGRVKTTGRQLRAWLVEIEERDGGKQGESDV